MTDESFVDFVVDLVNYGANFGKEQPMDKSLVPPDQYDHNYIICPWCKHQHDDDGFGDWTNEPFPCDGCERTFYVTIETSRTYTTAATKD